MMMPDLVVPNPSANESPFASTLRDVVASGDKLDIACPYIQLDILRGLVDDVETWRLITDLPEWFAIIPSGRHAEVADFLRDCLDAMRDVRGLHAKCVLGGDRAYTGSTNLTHRGLGANHELGVLLDEPEPLDELSAWFESLWSKGLARSASDIDALADLADEQTSNTSTSDHIRGDWEVESTSLPRTSIPDVFSGDDVEGASTTSSSSQVSTVDVDDDVWNRLVERLRRSPGRWWAEMYFELVEDVLKTTGLESGDPRLVTTVPTSDAKLCVSVNNRYVLTGMWKTDRDFGFIVGPDYELPARLQDAVVHPGYGFSPSAHETEETVPRFLAFEVTRDTTVPDGLIEEWTHYMTREKGYRSGSMHQQYHEPLVCRIVQDRGLRDRLS